VRVYGGYGSNFATANLPAGAYVGRILKGARLSDLPVRPSASSSLFVINLKTAKALGVEVPAKATCSRRRGDRTKPPFAAVHESETGTKLALLAGQNEPGPKAFAGGRLLLAHEAMLVGAAQPS
jgi:hypothetical protein